MSKIELRQYIGTMLDELAELADKEPDADLVKCAFQLRLISETIYPTGRPTVARSSEDGQLN